MKYNCIIVDDEPLAIEVIRTHALKTGILNITAEFSNAIEAFQAVKREKTDLIFLDIQMPGMKGTDFLKSLADPPKVILTTAYRDYAVEGYDLNVVDYLLKPVSYDRFLKAIDKFMSLETGKPPREPEEKYIYLNINKKVHKIYVNEIIYAESIKDYLTIHTLSGDIVAKHTISAFENLLPESEFVRIHRSFIVAIKRIKGFNSHTIDLGIKELPIGQNYQSSVFEKLKYPHFRI
ncbi:MAG TPA: LytTR family DNA-binding domain-containing protein [Bacteroidales bacterium]|nr:LytTR family DNA-binding domain-containing protein [Bacteroidales bacterium]